MKKTRNRFDAIEMKRKIQEQLAREFATLTPEERAKSERFRWLGSSAEAYLAEWESTWAARESQR